MSPSRTVTQSASVPRASAATWASTVSWAWPWLFVPTVTVTLPSGSTATVAASNDPNLPATPYCVGAVPCTSIDTPMPTWRPSARAAACRCRQPSMSKASTSWSRWGPSGPRSMRPPVPVIHGLGLSGSRLRRRTSTGSIPRSPAMRSSTRSVPRWACGWPNPR